MSNPVQIILLYGGPSINHILLEQSSTTKDVAVVHASWAKMNPVGIIKELSHFFCSLISTLIDIQRDVKMPALLTRRKQKNVVESGVCMA
jgi:hypothetical protein